MAVEEHGGGRQLVRLRSSPCHAPLVVALLVLLSGGAVDAALSEARTAFAFLAALAAFVGVQVVLQWGAAMAAVDFAVHQLRAEEKVERRREAAKEKAVQPMRPQLGQLQ